MPLTLKPLTFKAANEFVGKHHRHHKPVQGCKFVIGVESGGVLVGAVIVGRPVARILDDGYTAEVTRLVTTGEFNACSILYAAARRAAAALGYKKIITYILLSESGVSLKASGWVRVGEAGGGSWSRPSRGRVDKHPTEKKVKWEAKC